MKILQAPTEPFVKTQFAQLAADAAAGTNVVLTLENNEGLSNADFIAIGTEGSETCEIAQINQAVTPGTSVRVATLLLAHKSGQAVTKYRYNQRKFYGCTTETGSYTELTSYGSPTTIEVDDPAGTRLEYTGVEGYLYFKSTYFNSTTSEETDIADSVAVLADESIRYTSIYAIRRKTGMMDNPFYGDDRFETKRKQAENEINSALYPRYILPFSEIPALISQICELLAAGYINFEELGADGEGVKWLGEGRAILNQVVDGKRKLIDSNYVELARVPDTGVLDGYPNSTDTDAAQHSMSDKY